MLTQNDIQTRIPHRFENELIDTVTLHEDNRATCTLKVTDNDPLNRTIFMENNQAMSSLPAEILALASIVHAGPLPENTLVFFASISNFTYTAPLQLNAPITGVVTHKLNKGPFIKYSGSLSNATDTIATVDIMATISAEKPTPTSPQTSQPTPTTVFNPSATEWARHPDLIVCDGLINHTDTSITGTYLFPTTHPLIKGHFPDFPVMMGILQWQGVADTVLTYLKATKKDGSYSATCDAQLMNGNEVVSDIKNCQIDLNNHVENSTATITKTKKVTFKAMVFPGQQLTIQVTNLTLEKRP